ncbi:MAG: DUF192 domain-containing protein [Bacillota bacterium]
MSVYNIDRKAYLATRTEIANTFWKRFKGLLGRREFPLGSAMVIRPCNSVHTVAMRFSIDVIFIDRECRIIRMIHQMRPNRFSPIIRKAAAVVELPAGTLKTSSTKMGDRVKVEVSPLSVSVME